MTIRIVSAVGGWTYNDRGMRLLLRQWRWMAPERVRRPIAFEQAARLATGTGGGRRGKGGGFATRCAGLPGWRPSRRAGRTAPA